jgi:hypothetical protein
MRLEGRIPTFTGELDRFIDVFIQTDELASPLRGFSGSVLVARRNVNGRADRENKYETPDRKENTAGLQHDLLQTVNDTTCRALGAT